jgi:molybdate transport system substrate-binding protein
MYSPRVTTEALNEIAELFKVKSPETTLCLTLIRQANCKRKLENGAEADLFLSAATKQMTALSDGGYIDNDRKKIC